MTINRTRKTHLSQNIDFLQKNTVEGTTVLLLKRLARATLFVLVFQESKLIVLTPFLFQPEHVNRRDSLSFIEISHNFLRFRLLWMHNRPNLKGIILTTFSRTA